MLIKTIIAIINMENIETASTKNELTLLESTNVDKITENIFLGCAYGAEEFEYLVSIGVTHILRVCPQFDDKPNSKFTNKCISIDDSDSENIMYYFKEAIEFIESAGKVYVHCFAGVSRSPTIVIAYLMWKNKSNYNDTYWMVKNRRKFISPNRGFIEQLKKFEKILKENNWNLDFIQNI